MIDDDESVLLGFGTVLPLRVSAGATTEASVSITDDDDPQVTVSFDQDTFTVAEGNSVTVTVTLSADPERTVDIPITVTPQNHCDYRRLLRLADQRDVQRGRYVKRDHVHGDAGRRGRRRRDCAVRCRHG